MNTVISVQIPSSHVKRWAWLHTKLLGRMETVQLMRGLSPGPVRDTQEDKRILKRIKWIEQDA